MKNYYSIELVKKGRYSLITKVFGNYNKAITEFKKCILMYPKQRIELNSRHNVTTDVGYAPIAWNN